MPTRTRSEQPRAGKHVPRKRFGQHFLCDESVIERIILAIQPNDKDPFLEIGPGLGALTAPLLRHISHLHVLEIDRDIIPELENRCASLGVLQIHQADALSFDYISLAGKIGPLRLAGNLPYNISTPLLFRLLEAGTSISDMHFMLQKEVVDRITARPGTSQYGRLTVSVSARAHAEALFDVSPQAFRPPPRVTSTVVRITPKLTPEFPPTLQKNFERVLTAAFGQRRKTLSNALRQLLSTEQIRRAGIDPRQRAECLTTTDFSKLAAQLNDGQ